MATCLNSPRTRCLFIFSGAIPVDNDDFRHIVSVQKPFETTALEKAITVALNSAFHHH